MDEFNFQVDVDGKVIDCEAFYTFTKDDKNFIIYTDHILDSENEERLLASKYEKRDGKIVLLGDLTDEEYDLVDQEMEKFISG